eukprot:COSAG04_NODE_14475_length_566_cov_1.216274_2_plen_43_part_01
MEPPLLLAPPLRYVFDDRRAAREAAAAAQTQPYVCLWYVSGGR